MAKKLSFDERANRIEAKLALKLARELAADPEIKSWSK